MKTTKTDFRFFKRECGKWLARLGLLDWGVDFSHVDMEDDCIVAQMCPSEYTQKNCTLILNKKNAHEEWGEDRIARVAFHEVCHIFLYDIEMQGKMRYSTETMMDASVHAAINRLESAFFDQGL